MCLLSRVRHICGHISLDPNNDDGYSWTVFRACKYADELDDTLFCAYGEGMVSQTHTKFVDRDDFCPFCSQEGGVKEKEDPGNLADDENSQPRE